MASRFTQQRMLIVPRSNLRVSGTFAPFFIVKSETMVRASMISVRSIIFCFTETWIDVIVISHAKAWWIFSSVINNARFYPRALLDRSPRSKVNVNKFSTEKYFCILIAPWTLLINLGKRNKQVRVKLPSIKCTFRWFLCSTQRYCCAGAIFTNKLT